MLLAEGLKRTFSLRDREIEVIKGIDLQIESGEFVSIVGKSGSGKSTLLSLLAALDRPTSGKIIYQGRELQNLSEDELSLIRRHDFGFIFQSYHLIPTLTALENVLLPAQLAGSKESRQLAEELLARVELQNRADHYPKQMSGGEQQRVSICRALINNPKIIFADEPTGNLDSANGRLVLKLLSSLRADRSLILVTHDLDIARSADRVLEVSDGRIISSDKESIHARPTVNR